MLTRAAWLIQPIRSAEALGKSTSLALPTGRASGCTSAARYSTRSRCIQSRLPEKRFPSSRRGVLGETAHFLQHSTLHDWRRIVGCLFRWATIRTSRCQRQAGPRHIGVKRCAVFRKRCHLEQGLARTKVRRFARAFMRTTAPVNASRRCARHSRSRHVSFGTITRGPAITARAIS